MSSIFWSTPAPAPPPPPPRSDIGTLLLYVILGWIILRILQELPKSKKKKGKQKKEKKLLDDVIGLESVKEEIRYYMDFINNTEKYEDWNVKLPKGILLAGPPGTGKTLLVKTMAKVLDIPVITAAGSSFVEMYVGVGAKRIRDLFKKAKQLAKF